MVFRIYMACFLVFGLPACKTVRTGSGAKAVEEFHDLENLKLLTCEKGEVAYFSMKEFAGHEAYNKSSFAPLPRWAESWDIGMIDAYNLFRLETCVVDDLP